MERLSVLVCTMSDRLDTLRPEQYPTADGVVYVFSCQCPASAAAPQPPRWLQERPDASFHPLPGRGLSANRNHALGLCRTELAVIADDDVTYTAAGLEGAIAVFDKHPDVDIACFQATDMRGKPIKAYADAPFEYAKRSRGTYFTSIEVALRLSPALPRFDERFGLGSERLGCGEEEVFLCDACRGGLRIVYFPIVLCATDNPHTTGHKFYEEAAVRRAKGGVLAYCYPALPALLRILRHAPLIRRGRRLRSLADMLAGAAYIWKTRAKTPR